MELPAACQLLQLAGFSSSFSLFSAGFLPLWFYFCWAFFFFSLFAFRFIYTLFAWLWFWPCFCCEHVCTCLCSDATATAAALPPAWWLAFGFSGRESKFKRVYNLMILYLLFSLRKYVWVFAHFLNKVPLKIDRNRVKRDVRISGQKTFREKKRYRAVAKDSRLLLAIRYKK